MASTGGVLVRSGHTFTNVSNVDDDVLKHFVKGGSGNVQMCSGDALYHGNPNTMRQDLHVLKKYMSQLGHSGNISIMAGYATRKGGNVLLNGGDVAVPKQPLFYDENEDNSEEIVSALLESGDVTLRGGSVIEYDDHESSMNELVQGDDYKPVISNKIDGIGGDIDIAPGRGSEVLMNDGEEVSSRIRRRRHGKVVLRDHALRERILINER